MNPKMLLLTTVALAGVACAPPSAHRAPVVVGDSIAYGLAANHYLDRLGPWHDADTLPGRSILHVGNGLGAVKRLVGETQPGDDVIIVLGANDVGFNEPPEVPIKAVLNAIPQDRCVAWATVYHRKLWQRADAWNTTLRTLLAQRKCGRVIEWHDAVAKNNGLVVADGVHQTPAGQRVMTVLMVDAIK